MGFIGFILFVGGIASGVYGYTLNNDLAAQFSHFFTTGDFKSSPYLIGGAAAALVGLLILLFRRKK